MGVANAESLEVNIVGSSVFGRYNKISPETTVNMFISDNWLVNYAGFRKEADISPEGNGRGLFHSIRGDFLIAVVGASVYRISSNFIYKLIGTLGTNTGKVYIDENLSGQICLVDGIFAYIYDYTSIGPSFTSQTLTIPAGTGSPEFVLVPNYVCYHNSFFLFASKKTSENSFVWAAFEPHPTDPTLIQFNTQFSFQTKPDFALAVERIPGRGNNVLVMGSSACEVWTQVGGAENYRRVQSFNIDNGVIAPSTIAADEEKICWLGSNETNSPVILVTDGGSVQRISTDGIDHLLDQIKFPEQSYAFFFRQDGHLFYQLTFENAEDNLTLVYDFTTGKFFNLQDENRNYHPAQQVVHFNNFTYFVSLNDGGLYRMDSTITSYNYDHQNHSIVEEIPRIRICKTQRTKDGSTFRIGRFSFIIEQGVTNYMVPRDQPIPPPYPQAPVIPIPRVDMNFSKNGGETYSNIVSRNLNPKGKYKSEISWSRLGGVCNEFTVQLRFVGLSRMVVNNGVVETW
jgi:hypothetical protein